MKSHIFNTGVPYWLICPIFLSQPSSLFDYGIFTTVLPAYYMEAHTKMFEVTPDSTPTPAAAVEAENAQGRQSSDLLPPQPPSLSDLFNILIPWDSSCE